MISLNPFKKKEDDGFKLDEYSLPSLGDEVNNTQQSSNESELPSLGDSNAFANSMDNSNYQNNTESNMMTSSFPSQGQGVPGITTDPMLSSFNSTPVESHIKEQSQDSSTSLLHQDIAKAKMETIATKLELMEARQQSMDQKIEQIYQMLAMEISTETKKRLKVKSMMDSIKE